MTDPAPWSTGARGVYFLACLAASPLVGWGIVAASGVAGGLAAAAIVTLPAVLLLGYGIWHARRIMRTIRMRLGGAAAVPDDPVAERAANAFWTAGRMIGALMFVVALLEGRMVLGLAIGAAALLWGRFLGRAARVGRLPAPEFE